MPSRFLIIENSLLDYGVVVATRAPQQAAVGASCMALCAAAGRPS